MKIVNWQLKEMANRLVSNNVVQSSSYKCQEIITNVIEPAIEYDKNSNSCGNRV